MMDVPLPGMGQNLLLLLLIIISYHIILYCIILLLGKQQHINQFNQNIPKPIMITMITI